MTIRKDERFPLPTEVRVRRVSPEGIPGKEERTVATDLSRSGMRFLTSWSDLAAGDQVAIEELGGNFATEAIVRHVHVGADHMTRVGIEFIEKQAPDRMVGTTTGIPRPATVRPVAEALAYRAIPGPRTTGTIPRPRTTGSIPRPGATASIPRSVATSSFTRPTPPSPSPSPPPPSPPPPRSPESVREEIEGARSSARDLIAESRIWEALECLGRALTLAEGTSEAHAVRILIWETQARVPSLMRAAQENLEEMVRNDPGDVAVHSALGRIFLGAGLSARARAAFRQVLALDPSNREAAAAVEALNDPARRKS